MFIASLNEILSNCENIQKKKNAPFGYLRTKAYRFHCLFLSRSLTQYEHFIAIRNSSSSSKLQSLPENGFVELLLFFIHSLSIIHDYLVHISLIWSHFFFSFDIGNWHQIILSYLSFSNCIFSIVTIHYIHFTSNYHRSFHIKCDRGSEYKESKSCFWI